MSKLVLGAACILIALDIPAASQIQNGEFTGLITDPSDAVVNQARVLIRNLGTGYAVEVRSKDDGVYKGRELMVGKYRITVEMPGFRTATSGVLTLNAGTVVRADFHLQVGASEETIEVSDAATAVNTENTRLSHTVDSTLVANLPLNGRNVYDLIQYAPGATNVRGVIFEKGANTVVNGVRENFNGFLINGMANKGLSGGPVNQPIQDTVQELQVVTLNNSAEFGNSAGAITSLVTKSGTNQLHASAWEYFRNEALDATPFFANRDHDSDNLKKTPLRLNQFGTTLGGPIIKNNLLRRLSGRPVSDFERRPRPVESPQFRSAVIAAFPNSVAALLYQNFPPSARGNPRMTLRKYVTSPKVRFRDRLFPASPNTSVPEASISPASIWPRQPTCRTALRGCSGWSRLILIR